MVLRQILKRRDAASVVVAIVAALVIANYLTAVLSPFASWLLGIDTHTVNSGLRGDFLFPTLLMILQFLGFELLVRVYLKVEEKAK